MKLEILNEAPTLSQEVEKEAEAEKKQAEQGIDEPIDADKGQIESALNRAYETAQEQYDLPEGERDWPAILFIGEPGSGKTSRINAWAKRHGINLYAVQASTMEEVDLNGPVVMDVDDQGRKHAARLASIEFDKLNRPNSVLFLDEFNRARGTVRGTLLTLINDHRIPDPREPGGMRTLDNMLFTVAAINPDETTDEVEPMGQAERDRFRAIRIVNDKLHWLSYIRKRLGDLKKAAEDKGDAKKALKFERKIALISALVKNPKFDFDTSADIIKARENEGWNKLSLNNRNLTKLLDACNGTKEDFLDLWSDFCNNLRKPLVTRILSAYEDIPDKANDALAGGTESSIFGRAKKSSYDKIKDYLDSFED